MFTMCGPVDASNQKVNNYGSSFNSSYGRAGFSRPGISTILQRIAANNGIFGWNRAVSLLVFVVLSIIVSLVSLSSSATRRTKARVVGACYAGMFLHLAATAATTLSYENRINGLALAIADLSCLIPLTIGQILIFKYGTGKLSLFPDVVETLPGNERVVRRDPSEPAAHSSAGRGTKH